MFGYTRRILAASKRFVTIENGLTNSSGRLSSTHFRTGLRFAETNPIQPR